MATYSLANERLRALEDIEREIGAILQNAGTVILELSKEKTNERLLDRQAAAFTASVQHVEAELSAQIRYLTQEHSERDRGRDTGRGRSRLHAPGARRGTRSRISRIAPWAKGRRQTAAPPRDPWLFVY
ncbi:mediator of RNA polymerase II transcription subunit 11 isoform X1 [Vulpes lagopus]|uniref:mediator of RNA polymerase II transcription subunit 11 isoform X1 n=1 Tax=Vulpes lagopus TaxID=494514 RepID=UPI001BC8CB77|nr:mediator of RNA polymerase II transcription subunit 11 isoform X1 [Vulpes lagopus]